MKRIIPTLLLLFCFGASHGQVEYIEIPSAKFDAPRKVKLQLPRSYNDKKDKKYPVIIVLDGNYLFEPVAGNVDYFSYWEDMPEAIVIGVLHDDRQADTAYSEDTDLPTGSGAAFFEFIGMDLYSWLAKNYRISNFNMIVGHDLTANFANYYLLKEVPLFNAYISLSPDLVPEMAEWLTTTLTNMDRKIFYYQATGSDDIESLREGVKTLDTRLEQLQDANFKYYFDDFEGANHYTLAARAIPNAIEKVFSVFKPISKQEYEDVILKLDSSPYEYLVEKYQFPDHYPTLALFGIIGIPANINNVYIPLIENDTAEFEIAENLISKIQISMLFRKSVDSR